MPILALIPLLAGCAGAADLEAASAEIAPAEVALDPLSGSFVAGVSAPMPGAACEGSGTALTPTPAEGARVAWTLPPGTARVAATLSESAPPAMELGYSVCPFLDGEPLAVEGGVAPLQLDLATAGGSELAFIVAPLGGVGTINAGGLVEWKLEGVAFTTSAPAASA